MGYESKFYFVEHNVNYHENKEGEYFGRVVSMMDMCNFCGNPTTNTDYWTEVKGNLYLGEKKAVEYDGEWEAEGVYSKEDCYGDAIKFCSLEDFNSWLVEQMTDRNVLTYWRTSLLKSMVDAFRLNGKDNIVVVHYGY